MIESILPDRPYSAPPLELCDMMDDPRSLYPLTFRPVFRSYLWGGQGLRDYLQKNIPDEGIWAESWEVVDHGADQSHVLHGHFAGRTLRNLIESMPEAVLGSKLVEQQKAAPHASGSPAVYFPLLLKYLDCNQVLSVQVHPDDTYGLKMSIPDLGKTEAWYVVHAKPGSVIYAGLLPGVDRDQLHQAILAGKTEDFLHKIHPQTGDCIFIPAGTVHALGAGLVVAEIQQSSDTTFRLFDWNRTDAAGRGRPLHVAQALDVIDFNRGPIEPQRPTQVVHAAKGSIAPKPSDLIHETLVDCSKFTLERIQGQGMLRVDREDRFTIVTVPQGEAILEANRQLYRLSQGSSALLPAALSDVYLRCEKPDAVVLLAR